MKPTPQPIPTGEKRRVYRTRKEIIGAFAKWITRQYCYLDELNKLLIPCLKEVDSCCRSWPDQELDVLSIKDIQDFIRSIISVCPTVKSLNLTKIEREQGKKESTGYAFVSRYNELKPDHDFIDLDALKMNICNELEKYA